MKFNCKDSILFIVLLFTLVISLSFVSAYELDNSTCDLVKGNNSGSAIFESRENGLEDFSSASNDEELKDSQVVESMPRVDTGVVSGGVDLTTFNGRTTTGNVVYTVPTNQINLKSAIVVVNVYSGSGGENYGLYSNVTLNTKNGLEVLGYETLRFDKNIANDPNVYYVNDHATKQYSDYQMVYDITNKVKDLSPGDTINIGVENTKISDLQFDGSIKLIGLFYAYDDGDDDNYTYWLHLGQLWRSAATAEINFATQNYKGKDNEISLRTIALSSSLANVYKVNNVEITPTNVIQGDYYFNDIKWENIANAFNKGSNTNFFFQKDSGSYKTNVALLVASEVSTVEPLTEVYVNYATGSDDYIGTSETNAFKTIGHALSVIEPNGIIHLSGVNYLDDVGANGLTINKNITIIGSGDNVAIDANKAGRIFYIDGVTVNFSNIIFANADVFSTSDKRGGAIWAQNTILNIDNCKFINNTAGPSGSYGGAVNLKTSTATITNSYFDGNSAFYAGAGINAENGNILLNISNTVFTNNEVLNTNWATGGAICSYGTVIIDRSVFNGNKLASGKNGRSINQYQNDMLIITNSILLDGDLSVYHATPANAVLINNWWGNNDDNKDTTPKDLGYTNCDVQSYLYLNMTIYSAGMNVGDTATVNIKLVSSDDAEFNLPNLPVTITAVNGTVSVDDTTLVNGAVSLTYTITEVGNNAVTANVLGIWDTYSLSSGDVVSTEVVYVDANSGSDTNSGISRDKAFKTIEKAISAVEADGTIYVADGLYTLSDSTSANGISITKNIKIIGQSLNAIISGENAKRIFTIAVGNTLNITKLTLTKAKSSSYGGAIQIEDGGNTNPITQGYLIISDSIISDSSANYGGAIGSNRATISNINNVSFIRNYASSGGAIYMQQKGTITIGDDCKFINNTANGRASAIYAQAAVTTGKNNLFYGNKATGNYGYGAICSFGFTLGPGNVFINNVATQGGALYLAGNRYSATGSYAIFINNTDNNGRPIGKQSNSQSLTLNNCYWGTNEPDFSTLSNGGVTASTYLVLGITSEGNAIVGGSVVINIDLTKNQNGATVDINSLPNTLLLTFTVENGNVDPVETTLENGIGTTTYFPAVMGEGSVTANIYAPVGTLTFDVAPEAGTVFVNYTGGLDTNTGDSWANAVKTIEHALRIVGGGRTIYIAGGINYLDDADVNGLTIDKNISIIGIGEDVIIDANNASRIFYIDGLTVNFANIIFANANVGGASDKRGGAIWARNAILNIEHCKFINNTAGASSSYGGAVNLKSSTVSITDSYFEGNSAYYTGGAIYSENDNILLNISNSVFTNNAALNVASTWANGGAICSYGTLIVDRSIFYANNAQSGKSIHKYDGTLVITNSIVLDGINSINLKTPGEGTLENNWWGNNDATANITPFDLEFTNGNVELYYVLSSTLSQENVYVGDLITITTTLNGNVLELPVVITTDLGTVVPNETTMTTSAVFTYNATVLDDVVVTIDVLGIKNEIKFTVKETLPVVEITNVKTQWSDGIYPGVNNTFTITLNNVEATSVEGLVLEVYSNETGALIATYTIESLVSGASTISIIDPTIREITEQTVWPAAQNNKIKFTFNLMRGQDLVTTRSVDKILAYNGYFNKTYAYGGHGNIINRNYTITGDIIIATQDVSVYQDQYSRFRNETWNIETPEGADIVKVLLYFKYNWDTSFFPNGWSLMFNDGDISADCISYEKDRGNLGAWGAYDYGLLVFDVTEYYNVNQDNSFVINKTGNCALYPSTLYVLYNMENSHTTKEVYFSDICDVFYPNYNNIGYDDLIKFAVNYNGLNLENMTEATWYVFSGSSSNYNNLLFNSKEIENAFIGRSSNDCYPLVVDVTNDILENNVAWFVSTTRSSTTVAYEQVLVITKMEEVATSIEFTSIQGNGTISGILKDKGGLGIANQIIKIKVDGVEFGNTTTNDNGEFTIIGNNGVNDIIFEGIDVFLPSNKSITLSDITSEEETNKTISDLETQLAEAQANATSLANELAEAQSNLTASEAKVAELEGQLSDANQKIGNLTALLNEANNNITNLTAQLANVTAQLDEAQQQIKNLTSDQVPTTIDASPLKIKVLTNGKFQVTLKDKNGNVLANKKLSIIIDGVTNSVTTDDDGIAQLSVKYSEEGIYNVVVTFIGDKVYSASVVTSKIFVVKKATSLKVSKKIVEAKKKTKKATSLKVSKKIFKAKKKTKNVKITLKSKGKALAKKKVTLKIKSKTYRAKTNSKGVATIKVKLNKKGTYKFKATFAGDGTYKAISKKGKIKIK